MKPTFGSIPVAGVQPLSPTLDHVGLLARDVRRTALVFEAVTGRERAQLTAAPRLAVLIDQLADARLDDDVRAVVVAAIDRLRSRLVLEDRDGSALTHLNDVMGDIVHFEAWQVHGAAMTERPEHFGAPTARLFTSAAEISSARYQSALAKRDGLLPAAHAVLDGLDVLIGPAGPYVAPVFSPPVDTPEGAIEGIFTQPYNVTGQPAIVIPCGTTTEGLPVGLQLAAAPGADALLLAVAELVEQIFAEAER